MGYVGLLLAALILAILFSANIKAFFGKQTKPSSEVRQTATEAGVNASNYQSVAGDLKAKVNTASTEEAARVQDLEKLK